jgi:hypothetical protein
MQSPFKGVRDEETAREVLVGKDPALFLAALTVESWLFLMIRREPRNPAYKICLMTYLIPLLDWRR